MAKKTVTRQLLENTHSAAVASWAGAGASAVGAMQSARTARATEELLELQRAEAEQTRHHQFAMWRQTPDGQAFLGWKDRAVHLARTIRDRDAEWFEAWARAIVRTRPEVPSDEARRYQKHPRRVKQAGLKATAIVFLTLAALAGIGVLYTVLTAPMVESANQQTFTYEECLAELEKEGNILLTDENCEAIKPSDRVGDATRWFAVFSVLGAASLATRVVLIRRAKADESIARDQAARVAHFGFDPLALQPGQAPYPWFTSDWGTGYADRLMHDALNGHHRLPAQAELLSLAMPSTLQPRPGLPAEVNEVLTRFQQDS